jgi:hypothetical protein
MRTGSTGSLFNIESPQARPMCAERVCEEAFGRPYESFIFLLEELSHPGGGLTDHPKLIEKFSRGQIGRLERSPKWSHSHAIF